MNVVDASVVVDLLVPPTLARQLELEAELPATGDVWVAPDVLTYEVFSVLRRFVLRGALAPQEAWRRLARVEDLPIDLVPTGALLSAAWELRDNIATADSLYVALALRTGAEFLTTDGPLATAAAAAGATVRSP